MSKTKDTIQEMVTKVTESFPSVFSKDDVVKLLNELQAKLISQQGKNGDFDLEGFKTDLIEKIENEIDNFDFEDETELELNYNKTIEVRFDADNLKHTITRAVEYEFEQVAEVEAEEEVEN
jgi:hypothetical protein